MSSAGRTRSHSIWNVNAMQPHELIGDSGFFRVLFSDDGVAADVIGLGKRAVGGGQLAFVELDAGRPSSV